MWVYQETSEKVLAEPTPKEKPAESSGGKNISLAVSQLPVHPVKVNRRFTSRDCAVLAASYLFGTFLSGIVLALCRSQELDTLSAYLNSWSNLFSLDEPGAVWDLFGAEYMTAAGGATILLLLGLSAFGPVLIYLFAMLFGLGAGIIELQILLQSGWKHMFLGLFLTGIPTAAAVTCLCLFGASALKVSGRLQNAAFGKKTLRSSSGAKRLLGQYLALNVLFLPICGISTALVCLVHQLNGSLPN